MKFFQPSPSERSAFREGFKATQPLLLPFAAYAFVTGMAMSQTLSSTAALGMTVFVNAASSQLAALPLIVANLPILTILFTAISVNLRFTIFSASMQPRFSARPLWRRIALGYFNGDASYVLFAKRYPPHLHTTATNIDEHESYYLGLAMPNWLLWQAAGICGVLFGQHVPDSWDIGFAGILALLAITLPLLLDRAGAIAMLAAAIVCLLGLHWPYKLNIVAAVIAASLVGIAADRLLSGQERASTT